jgi:hypothetical protein
MVEKEELMRQKIYVKDGNGKVGIYGFELFQPEGRPAVAIFTELPENPAMSVTNNIERLIKWGIAVGVTAPLELTRTVWIDHSVASRKYPASYDRVLLPSHGCDVEWRHIRFLAEWAEMGIEPPEDFKEGD